MAVWFMISSSSAFAATAALSSSIGIPDLITSVDWFAAEAVRFRHCVRVGGVGAPPY